MQHVNPVTEFDVDDSQPVFASPVTDPSAAVPDNQVDSVVTSHHVDPLRTSKQPLPCLPTNSPRGYDHRHLLQHVPDLLRRDQRQVLQHVPDFDATTTKSNSPLPDPQVLYHVPDFESTTARFLQHVLHFNTSIR